MSKIRAVTNLKLKREAILNPTLKAVSNAEYPEPIDKQQTSNTAFQV
jgi:hypothetical protein